MIRAWDELNLTDDIGHVENPITLFAVKLAYENSRFPVANRYSDDDIAEKILEAVMDASAHLHEGAAREFNAPVGSRTFEFVPPNPRAGQRDYQRRRRYAQRREVVWLKNHDYQPWRKPKADNAFASRMEAWSKAA